MTLEVVLNNAQDGVELQFDQKPPAGLSDRLEHYGFKQVKHKTFTWYVRRQHSAYINYGKALKKALDKGAPFKSVHIQPSFEPSQDNIDREKFSYVSILYKKDNSTEYDNYVIFDHYKRVATAIAVRFGQDKYKETFKGVDVYPKHYKRNARVLLKEGKVINGVANHQVELKSAPEKKTKGPYTNEHGVYIPQLAGDRYTEIEIPIPKTAMYNAAVEAVLGQDNLYRSSFSVHKKFGDFHGGTRPLTDDAPTYDSLIEAIGAAIEGIIKRLEYDLEHKDSILDNEERKRERTGKAIKAVKKFLAEEVNPRILHTQKARSKYKKTASGAKGQEGGPEKEAKATPPQPVKKSELERLTDLGFKNLFTAREAFSKPYLVIDLQSRWYDAYKYFEDTYEKPAIEQIEKQESLLKTLKGKRDKNSREKRKQIGEQIRKKTEDVSNIYALIENENIAFQQAIIDKAIARAKTLGYKLTDQETITDFSVDISESLFNERAIASYFKSSIPEITDKIIRDFFDRGKDDDKDFNGNNAPDTGKNGITKSLTDHPVLDTDDGWTMTPLQYQQMKAIERTGNSMALDARDKHNHQAIVKQAIEDKRPVPKRVLEHYPWLVEQQPKKHEPNQTPETAKANKQGIRSKLSLEEFIAYGRIGFDKLSSYKSSVVAQAKKVMEEAIKLGYAVPYDYGRGKGKYTATDKAGKMSFDGIFTNVYNNIHIDQLTTEKQPEQPKQTEITYYGTHRKTMPFSEFIEIEVEERGNYSEEKIERWKKKYNISDSDRVLWVTPDKWVAHGYNLESEQRDKVRDIPEDQLEIVEIKGAEGQIIEESDDGDEGFLFLFHKSNNQTVPKYDYLDRVIGHLHEKYANGERPTKGQIEKLGKDLGVPNRGMLWEAAELSWLLWYKQIYKEPLPFEMRLQKMVHFWDNLQPTYAYSDSSKELYRQYSTPCPIGAMIAQYTGMDKAKSIFEPSAGNGLLLVGADPRKTHVNEIDHTRLASLKYQGFAKITSDNAAGPFDKSMTKAYDVVITNPPFSRWEEEKIDKEYMVRKYFNNMIGLAKFIRLEHLMVALALHCMKDNGKAAIIIMGHVYFSNDGFIAKWRPFFNWLYRHYLVSDVINLNSFKLYNKQGAIEKTMLILVNGRKPKPESVAPQQHQAPHLYGMVDSFDALWGRIKPHIGYTIDTLIKQLKIELGHDFLQ